MSRLSMMLPIAQFIPGTDRDSLKTYAAYPVWSESTTKKVKFAPLAKREATRLWHRARDFDRQTREPGKHGGSLGHAALQVLHALIFDFLNFNSGRLDPSYAAIARKANVCARTVASAIQRLKFYGILNWVRRCAETRKDGRYVLEQDTNAYAVLPSSQWRGYTAPPDVPLPELGTWGDHPPLPDLLAQAVEARRDGASPESVIKVLELAAPQDAAAAALARLGRAIRERDEREGTKRA